GIRDLIVTGVQTCALPIFHGSIIWSAFVDQQPGMAAQSPDNTARPQGSHHRSHIPATPQVDLTLRSWVHLDLGTATIKLVRRFGGENCKRWQFCRYEDYRM